MGKVSWMKPFRLPTLDLYPVVRYHVSVRKSLRLALRIGMNLQELFDMLSSAILPRLGTLQLTHHQRSLFLQRIDDQAW